MRFMFYFTLGYRLSFIAFARISSGPLSVADLSVARAQTSLSAHREVIQSFDRFGRYIRGPGVDRAINGHRGSQNSCTQLNYSQFN